MRITYRTRHIPVDDPTKGIFLDAQTGCIAAVDDLTLQSSPVALGIDSEKPAGGSSVAGVPKADSGKKVHFSFEPPQYLAGRDVVGTEHWQTSSFSTAPATSIVAAALKDPALSELERKLKAARRRTEIPELRMRAATTRMAASTAALASLEARIAADRDKYGLSPAPDSSLAIQAARSERQAESLELQASLARDQYVAAVAEAKSDSDQNRAMELVAANKRLAATEMALEKFDATHTDKQPDSYSPLTPVYPQTSTGRRLALARWITSRDNPLTARVAINHIWMRHFHAPLVQSVYDFGRNGTAPSHPELMDWLAVELIDSGWSMKHIHRLIMTSNAYRRSSNTSFAEPVIENSVRANQEKIDNRLLWRMNAGRMEAEVIRDSLLHCGQLIDFTMGGRPLGNDQALKTFRRSLYYESFPEDGGTSELSDLFDAPSPLDCYRRTRSIVPQQALALTNSDLVHQVAAKIVANWESKSNVAADSQQAAQFVKQIFELILTRPPTDAELDLCLEGLGTQRELWKRDSVEQISSKARQSVVRALLNHNDFITVR